MTYIASEPVTGFTLELDGDHEAVARIWREICRAMQAEYERMAREQRSIWGGHPQRLYEIRPLLPFHGELRLRTTKLQEP